MNGNFENLRADLEYCRPQLKAVAARPNRLATYLVAAILLVLVCAQAAMVSSGIIRP